MRFVALSLITCSSLLGCVRSSAAPQTAPAVQSSGRFIWHDLSTDDLSAARRFYGTLLGWKFRDVTRLGKPYVIASLNQQPVAGLVAVDPVPDQEVSRWVPFLSVENVDDAVVAIQRAGGSVLVAPLNIDSAGRAGVVTDPQGAVLGLARLIGNEPPDPATPQEGTFFWMEYLAQTPADAVAFYTSTFGYEQKVAAQVGTSSYVVLSRGQPRGGVLQTPNPDMRSMWLPSILVKDPAALAAQARTLGGVVLVEPRPDIRNGSVAVVADPSGGILALQKYPF